MTPFFSDNCQVLKPAYRIENNRSLFSMKSNSWWKSINQNVQEQINKKLQDFLSALHISERAFYFPFLEIHKSNIVLVCFFFTLEILVDSSRYFVNTLIKLSTMIVTKCVNYTQGIYPRFYHVFHIFLYKSVLYYIKSNVLYAGICTW